VDVIPKCGLRRQGTATHPYGPAAGTAPGKRGVGQSRYQEISTWRVSPSLASGMGQGTLLPPPRSFWSFPGPEQVGVAKNGDSPVRWKFEAYAALQFQIAGSSRCRQPSQSLSVALPVLWQHPGCPRATAPGSTSPRPRLAAFSSATTRCHLWKPRGGSIRQN